MVASPLIREVTSMQIRLFALSVLAGLGACSSEPVRIVRDPALADAETFEVRGVESRSSHTPVTFGNFSTEQMDVGTTQTSTREATLWGWTSDMFQVLEGFKYQPYRFVLIDEDGEQWQIECRANTPITIFENEHDSWTHPTGDTLLGCAARDPRGFVSGLELAGNRREFAGYSDFADPPLEIVTLHELAGLDGRSIRVPGVLGYELRQEGSVLATMDLVDDHRLYFARTLPLELRPAVAATLVVLMFFNPAD
jgi:hypothetical protein